QEPGDVVAVAAGGRDGERGSVAGGPHVGVGNWAGPGGRGGGPRGPAPHGGADERAGSGLVGIRRRVAALDGTTRIDSPTGGPTRIEVELPCGS
ncbi:hypothetical protein ACFV1Q_00240, partial [Streptomyces sp. NPDC059604]